MNLPATAQNNQNRKGFFDKRNVDRMSGVIESQSIEVLFSPPNEKTNELKRQ